MLELDAVTKRFGGLTAVGKVSLRASPGEILGIIGPNGAGKTTLFNVISGFYPPDEGRVLLDGRDVSHVPAHRICALARSLPIGLRKRLEVARALATKPRLLLLDEVMAGLNATELGEMVTLLRRLHGEGLGLIIIEHIMAAMMRLAQRIVVLHHGEKIAEGTPEAITRDPRVVDAYLGEEFVLADA